jgi:hypothetical protein
VIVMMVMVMMMVMLMVMMRIMVSSHTCLFSNMASPEARMAASLPSVSYSVS